MNMSIHAQSVEDFCNANGISQSFFYKLAKQGKAPRTMKVGRRTLVSSEAAQEWREEMESQV